MDCGVDGGRVVEDLLFKYRDHGIHDLLSNYPLIGNAKTRKGIGGREGRRGKDSGRDVSGREAEQRRREGEGG